jgi:hypothetical protein
VVAHEVVKETEGGEDAVELRSLGCLVVEGAIGWSLTCPAGGHFRANGPAKGGAKIALGAVTGNDFIF